MDSFKVPVVLFFFKRIDKTLKIINKIAEIRPSKMYLISDGARDAIESELVNECRKQVEASITWDCNVIKNYAEENKGVYDRIGLGARWVFEKERTAVFLEDDNLPSKSFFRFCEEMLEKYEHDTRVLWVCGTNYLGRYSFESGASYVFTRHMMPCGWASWANKFIKFYDGEMRLWENEYVRKRVQAEIEHRPLARQLKRSWESTAYQFSKYGKPVSWDHQMSLTQRSQNLYAIVPKNNLIENIGVDIFSTHGGTSFRNKMTRRFCGIEALELEFPLIHPLGFMTDIYFDKRISETITLPLEYRIKGFVVRLFKRILRLNLHEPLRRRSKTLKE